VLHWSHEFSVAIAVEEQLCGAGINLVFLLNNPVPILSGVRCYLLPQRFLHLLIRCESLDSFLLKKLYSHQGAGCLMTFAMEEITAQVSFHSSWTSVCAIRLVKLTVIDPKKYSKEVEWLFWFFLAHLTNWNLACIIWLLCLFTKSKLQDLKVLLPGYLLFFSISYFTCVGLRVT